MSRRDAGAARQGSRHARDRLQSTLGSGSGLLADGEGKVFEYDGGADLPDGESAGDARPLPGAGRPGPALRWRVGLRVAILVGALAALGGAWFWSQVAAGHPVVMPLGDVSLHGPGPVSGAEGHEVHGAVPVELPPGDGDAAQLVIHVAGAVAVPGVVRLPAGSRVHEAMAAAGGGLPSADVNALNLAAVLTDGQKLHVPQVGEPVPGDVPAPGVVGDGTGRAGPAGEKVNLNTAGVEELDALPKVGPVLAQRIVDWRKEHGPFTSVEELDAVDGVGPKMLETLLPLVGV